MIRKKHMTMIQSIAVGFHRTTGMPLDELFAEAALAYCEALLSFRPSRGKLATWATACMRNHLVDFVAREKPYQDMDSLDVEWIDFPYSPTPFFEIFDSMTEDAREIAQMVLDDPYLYLTVPQRVAKGFVAVNLVKDKNWTWARIWTGIRNLKSQLT